MLAKVKSVLELHGLRNKIDYHVVNSYTDTTDIDEILKHYILLHRVFPYTQVPQYPNSPMPLLPYEIIDEMGGLKRP